MVGQRKDQSVVALGRSGTGKTTLCQAFASELLKHAGTAGENFTCKFIFHTLGHVVPCPATVFNGKYVKNNVKLFFQHAFIYAYQTW